MLLDNTIQKVIEKLQTNYKKEFGKELSQEQIFNIIDSQFASIPKAMKNKLTVKLDKLGKFKIKEGRAKALKKLSENK